MNEKKEEEEEGDDDDDELKMNCHVCEHRNICMQTRFHFYFFIFFWCCVLYCTVPCRITFCSTVKNEFKQTCVYVLL